MKRVVGLLTCLALAVAPGVAVANESSDLIADMLDGMNVILESQGADYRAAVAEYITDGDEVGNTVITKVVGNKQLGFDFVPFDSRRAGWSGPTAGPMDDITYAIDTTGDAVPPFGGLAAAQTDAAIVRGMNTWDALTCSTLPLMRNPDFGIDIGVVADILGLGGSPFVLADVQHAGWRDINFAGGILGVTFTFGFCAPCAPTTVFTDIDNNGKLDAAFREIYYDPSFNWADDGVTDVDVESVAVHEAGHGISQAHFGKVFFDNNGNLKFAPKAVMNAVYAAPQRALLGTDVGGHCSNWAQWPNN